MALIETAIRQTLERPREPIITIDKSQFNAARQNFSNMPGGLVLKAPRTEKGRVLEKGAVLLKNTQQFAVFRQLADVAAILREYDLVLEPSWSGYADRDILYFTRFAPHPIIVMATDQDDYRFIERLNSNLLPVSFGASDWANPSIFQPLGEQEKQYDAVMVARWTVIKRHHVLFRVLRKLADPSFRVAFISQTHPADTDRDSILRLMRHQGVSAQTSIFEDIEPAEVNRIYNQSRVNLLLSRQEGSNRSLFEGFFANIPGLALENNVGLPKSHFTAQTGKLINERELASELLFFRKNWRNYEPRQWAMTHIAPALTTARLESELKILAQQRGETWTRGIVGKYNGPDLRYYPDRQAGAALPAIADLIEQHPGQQTISAGNAR